MPTAPFPHVYVVSLANGELGAPPRSPVKAGAPPQFGGSDQVWSPEELLVGAALLCLQTTFTAYAKRAGLEVHAWRGTGTGTLVKATGGPVFSAIDLDVELATDPADEPRARQALDEAERACIVSRALSVPVHVSCSFATPSARAAG